MSQATKILMNSFYGILGATGCRFHDARLASSITRRGHEIIRRTRDVIEEGGETVIYGDTDSLFVLLGAGVDEAAARERGRAIAVRLNEWWRRTIEREHRLDSFLEIEFETHFLRFLMPTVRGDVTGSKKRYAGMVRAGDGGHDLVFKGLESVRTTGRRSPARSSASSTGASFRASRSKPTCATPWRRCTRASTMPSSCTESGSARA